MHSSVLPTHPTDPTQPDVGILPNVWTWGLQHWRWVIPAFFFWAAGVHACSAYILHFCFWRCSFIPCYLVGRRSLPQERPPERQQAPGRTLGIVDYRLDRQVVRRQWNLFPIIQNGSSCRHCGHLFLGIGQNGVRGGHLCSAYPLPPYTQLFPYSPTYLQTLVLFRGLCEQWRGVRQWQAMNPSPKITCLLDIPLFLFGHYCFGSWFGLLRQ